MIELADATTPSTTSLATAARALRLRRRLTLDQLADLAGLSKGHLSRFERGEKALSVAALMRLSQALAVPVSALLGEAQPDGVPHLVRRDARRTGRASASEGGYSFALLSRATGGAGMEVFVLELTGGLPMDGAVHAGHGGLEGLFVLSGEVEIEIARQRFRLAGGDYIEFPGSSLHFVQSLAPRSEVLVVVGQTRGDGG